MTHESSSREFEPHEGPEPYVFISYKHRICETQLNVLFQKLTERKIRFWYDAGLNGGDIWKEKLVAKIRQAHVFFAMLSDEYYESEDCLAELSVAMNEKIPLIPIVCSPIRTGSYQYMQEKVNLRQRIPFSKSDNLFTLPRVQECGPDYAPDQQAMQDESQTGRGASESEQEIHEPMSVRSIEKDLDDFLAEYKMFPDPEGTKKKLFSRPQPVYTPYQEALLRAKAHKLLRNHQEELQILMNTRATPSRTAYKQARTVALLSGKLAKSYDFWPYEINQKLYHFVSDSAPLLRLMSGRALRDEPFLSPAMLSALKIFLAELNGLENAIQSIVKASPFQFDSAELKFPEECFAPETKPASEAESASEADPSPHAEPAEAESPASRSCPQSGKPVIKKKKRGRK